MKKRLCALLLGILFVTTPVITVFAENGDKTDAASEQGMEPIVTTGTYERALENKTDVDEDIKEEVQAVIPEEIEEITIGTTEEFLEFANNCRLDTWSVNKKITLTDDISLLGTDFIGIPSFGGIFDGAGHTISAFNVDKSMSYIGLFTNVQKTGVITNLNVKGNIIPAGEQITLGGIAATNSGYIHKCSFTGVVNGNDYVGGVVGANQLTGVIDDCNCAGYVHGVHFTGGIAGSNMGYITDSVNDSSVNTTNTDTQITIDSMSTLNKVISLVKNANSEEEDANADVTASDTGGVAGQSIGIIIGCVNTGNIGYEHVGYNVGGIAGRQSGYLFKCTNSGNILGRKDVGGIVGQAEPYITVDLSTDIAYQLTEAIGKLHDLVSVTLRDTRNQSNVISNRLSIIQDYTGKALNDVKYIANGTIDYANGVSGAATEAFSRVDYVIDEATKKNGALDHTEEAMKDVKKSAGDIRTAFSKLDVDAYIPDNRRDEYNAAKTVLEGAEAQYSDNYSGAITPCLNNAIYAQKENYASTKNANTTGTKLVYISSATGADITAQMATAVNATDIQNKTGASTKGSWQHEDGTAFPSSDNTKYPDDAALYAAANTTAITEASKYAINSYDNGTSTGAVAYEQDVLVSTQTVMGILTEAAQYMADDIRPDVVKSMQEIEDAAGNLESAGHDTRSILNNIAGRDNITFPTFSDEYRLRTTSFVDNMQGMNDNFGLLNSEINNATGVLTTDLEAVNDQFNTIMLLFTDAADGVLEMDYTQNFEDVSLDEADTCTDATVDYCINYGRIEGDIDVAGIAGTMGIEYEYDKESDITGIKDSKLTTSYLTKCVLRHNDNYNSVVGEKNYVGGICGLQEMGTITGCANMGNAKSSSGEYVGGICGRSLSNIVKSSSSGILDGVSYVGGITGDGMNISDCQSLVKVTGADRWYGAISGHIDEKGVVRNNSFISDELTGIDRSSYTGKAEEVVFNSADVPYDFKSMTIAFMLEDEDLPDGEKIIKKSSLKYGEAISEENYPRVDDKEGYYVVWDKPQIDKVTTDEIITANYIKYRTTIAEEKTTEDDGIHQGEILVDGQFREEDRLVVERETLFNTGEETKYSEEGDKLYVDYEILKLTIPDDGRKTHQIRFGIDQNMQLGEQITYELYQVQDDGSLTKLEKTGNVGKYDTYDVEGDVLTLDVKYKVAKYFEYLLPAIAIGAIVLVVVIIALAIFIIKRHGRRLPVIINNVAKDVSKKIEDKEQLFYDDSKDEQRSVKEEEDKKEENKEKEDIAEASEKADNTEEKADQKPENKKKKKSRKNK